MDECNYTKNAYLTYLTYYQENRKIIINRAKDYYESDKERLRKQAKDKYKNVSEED